MKLSKITRIVEKSAVPTLKQRFDKSTESLVTPEPVNEGPFDFIRGASREAGRQVGSAARSVGNAVAQPVRNAVAAGQTASAVGELEKVVAQMAVLLQRQGKQPSLTNAPAAQPSNSVPAGTPQVKPKSAFQADHKPRMSPGKYGAEFKFESMSFGQFMEITHQDELDEGIWDFVKGAGKEVATQTRKKINQFADRPSVFKDIYNAGTNAHQAGQARKEQEALAAIPAQLEQLQVQLRTLAAKVGPGQLTAAIRKAGGTQADNILKMIGLAAS